MISNLDHMLFGASGHMTPLRKRTGMRTGMENPMSVPVFPHFAQGWDSRGYDNPGKVGQVECAQCSCAECVIQEDKPVQTTHRLSRIRIGTLSTWAGCRAVSSQGLALTPTKQTFY